MHFSKMHGLGNDFIIVNGFKEKVNLDPVGLAVLSKKICHRQLGIGADGLILLLPSEIADAKFVIYNSDGSRAEMCGNGVRCAAIFAKEQGIIQKDSCTFETLKGIVAPTIVDEKEGTVNVDMGIPAFAPMEIPAKFHEPQVIDAPLIVGSKFYNITLVSMGNPHCVVFVDDLKNFPVGEVGPLIENHPVFPARINAEFVEPVSMGKIKMRVWERGCGETSACGTGACAAAIAAHLNGFTTADVEVELAYGSLFVKWKVPEHVFLLGPTAYICEGEYPDLLHI